MKQGGSLLLPPCLRFDAGGVLLSHTLASAVPLALVGLASVFGMGTGVSSPLLPPAKAWGLCLCSAFFWPGLVVWLRIVDAINVSYGLMLV